MLDFKVKSRINDYHVYFINNALNIINKQTNDGDYIIIDRSIIENNKNYKKEIKSKNIIIIDANEKIKSYEGTIPIIFKLINSGFKKNNRLIAVGGGITQDLTAFISSILYRGVKWVFFPTTLLAQSDSCIGSKTSINFGSFKNQVGGFYPPEKIFIDLNFLKSLKKVDIQSGFGEMCHYFVIAGEKKFKEYKEDYETAMKDDFILSKTISNSLKIKKKLIEIDEFDSNERQIFNYGHSFGHAIESLTNYNIPHGIAVSFGIDMANYVSVKKGYLNQKIRIEIRQLLKKIWKGFSIKSLDVDKFINALKKDKKNVGDELRLILCKEYGNVFKDAQPANKEFKIWLDEYFINEAY